MEHRAGLSEPLAQPLRRALRHAVRDHALGERPRSRLPILHVGAPDGRRLAHPVHADEAMDHSLRADVVAALVHRLEPSGLPLVWLTRPGDLLVDQDVDIEWLAGARQAFAEAGRPLIYVVVSGHGWRDPRSGLERRWARVRRRSGVSPSVTVP
ncbi:hypothetical protein JCM18899A_13010 [Nocardioides sp. AN3]